MAHSYVISRGSGGGGRLTETETAPLESRPLVQQKKPKPRTLESGYPHRTLGVAGCLADLALAQVLAPALALALALAGWLWLAG